MKEKWIELKKLLGLPEMPDTIQGITYRAKSEKWQRRRKEGVKGRIFEYNIEDMPQSVQQALDFEINKPAVGSRDDLIITTPSGGEYGFELKARRLKGNVATIGELHQAIALIEDALAQINKPQQQQNDDLNNIERHLVKCFRNSNEQGRVAILNIAETMANMKKEEEESELSEALVA